MNTGIRDFQGIRYRKNQNYDTFCKNYDTSLTKRLYRVGNIFYYRRRINKKLFRISLHTADIQLALKRKKLLDMLKGEELFELTTKDLKLVFEYDTEEELKIALENFYKMQVQEQVKHYKTVKQEIQRQVQIDNLPDKFTFKELKDKYLAQAVYDGNVKESSITDYTTTFNRLIEYFTDKDINSLSVEDIEAFKLHLNTIIVRKKNLSKKTINKHLIYTKQFLKFAVGREYILKNVAEPVKLYNKRQTKEQEPEAENFTNDEIQKILNKKIGVYFDKTMKTFCEIAIYTGMRLSEVNSLKQTSIKQDNGTGIYYFDLKDSKTSNGIRQVPIHKNILDNILKTELPLYHNKSNDSIQKKINRQLKKFLPHDKTFKSFRGTFMEKAINKHPDKITLVQDIVGHSKSEQNELTVDRYAKGFNIELKKEVVDSVSYE